jgi:hypothetical protein
MLSGEIGKYLSRQILKKLIENRKQTDTLDAPLFL